MIGDEYESTCPRGEAKVLVFNLAMLAEALLLISLLLPPLLFSLAPIEDELAHRSGGAEALPKAAVVY